MPILPLVGHDSLRERLLGAARAGTLPASLLLHGPRGVGKQRLALWLGQALLCAGEVAPCGACQHCRYAVELQHPDLHWFFPRPRLKEADPSVEDVAEDYGEAIGERVKAGGVYAPPAGNEALYVATMRAVVQRAAIRPAMARRKTFVLGDAERMVPQEGADAAANAFLKLLEEPPADTTLILTSSEPGALLPTIRSRVVAVRVPPLGEAQLREFLALEPVRAALADDRSGDDERVSRGGGAPGSLLGGERVAARDQARRLVEAAEGGPAQRHVAAFGRGAAGARGAFSEILDEVTVLLHARARDAAGRDDARGALGASRGVVAVERAKALAGGNVNPQLVTARLLGELAQVLQ